MINCPKCESNTETVVFDGVEVDRCQKCKGIWFDKDELVFLESMEGSEAIDLAVDADDSADEAAALNCPRCKEAMTHVEKAESGIFAYEFCSICQGTFFDAGEFRKFKALGQHIYK